MQNRLNLSIKLMKQTALIVRHKMSLLIFPFVGSLLIICVLFFAIRPLAQMEEIAWKTNQLPIHDYFIFLGIVFLLFGLINLITLVFNAILTICAIKHIRHETYTIGFGFKTGLLCIGRLFKWRMFSNTVGLVVRFLEYWVDSWPSYSIAKNTFLNLKIHTAAFFITPVITQEKLNSFAAIRRSANLIKNKWGESPSYKIGIGIIIFLLSMVFLMPAVIALLIGGKTIFLISSTISSILLIGTSIVYAALNTILNAALYLYATDVDVSEFYETELFKSAF
jgi:hypothetical protein